MEAAMRIKQQCDYKCTTVLCTCEGNIKRPTLQLFLGARLNLNIFTSAAVEMHFMLSTQQHAIKCTTHSPSIWTVNTHWMCSSLIGVSQKEIECFCFFFSLRWRRYEVYSTWALLTAHSICTEVCVEISRLTLGRIGCIYADFVNSINVYSGVFFFLFDRLYRLTFRLCFYCLRFLISNKSQWSLLSDCLFVVVFFFAVSRISSPFTVSRLFEGLSRT